MRVKMHKLLAGPGGSMEPGKEYPVSEELGRALVAAEAASIVGTPSPVPVVEATTSESANKAETATIPVVETTTSESAEKAETATAHRRGRRS